MNEDFDILKYGRDVTKLSKEGKIEPVIGRDQEIREIIKILSRKTKNNPVLIGEPGVGKTAIIEGLANRIIKDDVPNNLKNKTIFELDMASLIAGAKYQGEFEERLKNVLNEVKKSDGGIIMFIDEIHLIVGAGRTQGALDASNMLKPMLARGELHCIGATTLNEYRKYIETDMALERRFQRVLVEEPSVVDTISILRGLKSRFEAFHGVKITDNAIVQAVNLSNRYITDRKLPDKAIDLIDEASASIKIQLDSVPQEIDELNRTIITLEVEKSSLTNETNEISKVRLNEINDELNELKTKYNELNKKWLDEKSKIDEKKKLKLELEHKKFNLENLLANAKYDEAAKIQYQEIPELEKKINEISENKILSEVVDNENICQVISKWTKIPVSKLLKGDREKVLNLKNELNKRVIGQDNALELVSNSIIRQRAGIKDSKRPIGSFLFLGPTGVGKTEVAKTLANSLFDSEDHIIRIDMSEYMEKFSVSRLIGAPPGYVGYDEGGQLTEMVRRNPYSIILFDEIEKAHNEVFNLLLQVLDDGRLTDSQGRIVDFKNTIIIMTSNLGSNYLLEDKEDLVYQLLREKFKPEFLNRIDEIVLFKPLNKETQYLIVDKLLNDLANRLKENYIEIKFTDNIKKHILDEAYSIEFGARPLKRYISKFLENELAKKIILEEIIPNNSYIVDYFDEIQIKKAF